MKIDHIGYAVKDINKAKMAFEVLGYSFGELFEDNARNVLITFGKNNGYIVELISPLSNTKKSSVDEILKKNGSIPYHICYTSERIEFDIEELCKKKFKVIKPLEEAIAFSGRRVVFLYNPYVGIVEIVEQ